MRPVPLPVAGNGSPRLFEISRVKSMGTDGEKYV